MVSQHHQENQLPRLPTANLSQARGWDAMKLCKPASENSRQDICNVPDKRGGDEAPEAGASGVRHEAAYAKKMITRRDAGQCVDRMKLMNVCICERSYNINLVEIGKTSE